MVGESVRLASPKLQAISSRGAGALAKKHVGLKHGFERLLYQSRLGGASLLVVAEEARQPFEAVTVASPCGFDLVGLKNAYYGRGWLRNGVASVHLSLEARRQAFFVEAPHSVVVVECREVYADAAVPVGSRRESAAYVSGERASFKKSPEVVRRGEWVRARQKKHRPLLAFAQNSPLGQV